MEKTIILGLVVMLAIITPTVWIGPTRLLSESAEAKTNYQADTQQEGGIVRDAQGRICDFGLHHDECPNASNTMPPGSKADSGDDVSGFPILPPGQHYAGCEEDVNHELGCDAVNDTSSP